MNSDLPDLHNFLWFIHTPGRGGSCAGFEVYFYSLIATLFFTQLAICWVGTRHLSLRKYLLWILALGPSFLGLIFPMIGHGGDTSDEMLRYYNGLPFFGGPVMQMKLGEIFGTLPFYVLGQMIIKIPITNIGMARLLSFIGFFGGLGLVKLARRLFPFRDPATLTNRDWIFVCLILLAPSLVLNSGFIQTTVVANVLLPWFLYFLIGIKMPERRKFVWAGVFMAVLYQSHSIIITLLISTALAALFWSIKVFKVKGTWKAGFNRYVPTFLFANFLILGLVFVSKRIMHWDMNVPPWSGHGVSLEQALINLTRITHKIPSWVPILGSDRLFCGQQTEFFTSDWALFTLSALAQSSLIIPGLLLFRNWKEALGRPTEFFFMKRGHLILILILNIGMILVVSPHFAYPRDVDIILIPGFLINLTLVILGSRSEKFLGTQSLVCLFIYNALITATIVALQYTYANCTCVRGLSASVCSC